MSTTTTAGLVGIDACPVTITVTRSPGDPALLFQSLHLDDSRERVRAAMRGLNLPARRLVVQPSIDGVELAGVDLAIAVALLIEHGRIPAHAVDRTLLWGELELDGSLRATAGAVIIADLARREGLRLIVPERIVETMLIVPGVDVIGVRDLNDVIDLLSVDGRTAERKRRRDRVHGYREVEQPATCGPDLADILGLEVPRRALEVAAAGGFNLLLWGPPGVGKTMLARRLAGILPDLDDDDALEVTKVHSLAHRKHDGGLIRRPPVRMPHHTVSEIGLLGGGKPPRPGEVSLAHCGVLFLDELPEFSLGALERLRAVMVDRETSVVYKGLSVTLPARTQLIAAMNPCPCGYAGQAARACTCSAQAIATYQRRVSTLLPHFHLAVEMASIDGKSTAREGESTASVRARVEVARRARDLGPVERGIDPEALERIAAIDGNARRKMTTRRVARVIQDLDPAADLAAPVSLASVEQALELFKLPTGLTEVADGNAS